MNNYLKWNITMTGTLILAYLMLIVAGVSAIMVKSPDPVVECSPYVAALAGVRALAGRLGNGKAKSSSDNNSTPGYN